MADYKKLILGLGIKEGKAYPWNGQAEYRRPLMGLVRTGCDSGTDQVLLCDHSKNGEDHEAVIGLIKGTTRTMDGSILAGGRVRGPEDIRKYLYAGTSVVFLGVSREDDVDTMKGAAGRFGNEKIYAYLPDITYIPQAEEYAQLGASMMVLRTSTQVPFLRELEEIGESERGVLTFCGGHQPAQDMAGELKIRFGCPLAKGAILALEEESTDTCTEVKQMFRGAGIETDTFKSTVAWKDFKLDSDGPILVIVQDHRGSEVLMMAYMNEESYEATLAIGKMTYFSRNRQKLWLKEGTSGRFQCVRSLELDCDNDTVLAMVKQIGGACRTGSGTCFSTTLAEKEHKETNPLKVFENMYGVILDQKEHSEEGSYTNYPFDKDIGRILRKPGEEATEIIIATKNSNPEKIKYEISDFLYHMMVLMVDRGIPWEEITEELANR